MPTLKKMTINEIALSAGVSKGTVSKVMNNRPGVGKSTRDRILSLIEELHFHPSSAARALSNRRSNNIGLIIPHEAGNSLNGSYWSSIITAITQEASLNDYNTVLFTPRKEGELEELYRRILSGNKVDGLIIGSELLDKNQIKKLQDIDLPYILIGQYPGFQHHYVDIDNAYGAQSMTEYMIDRGYRNIAFLSGPLQYYYNKERLEAYRSTLKAHGLSPYYAEAVHHIPESVNTAVESLIKICTPMDALFIGGGADYLYGVLKSLKKRGILYTNIGITIFDDYPYFDFMDPQLTAIKQPVEQLGTQATESLLHLIQKENEGVYQNIFPTTITERSSCPVLR